MRLGAAKAALGEAGIANRPGQRIRDRHVVGAWAGQATVSTSTAAGAGWTAAAPAGSRGDVLPRDGPGWPRPSARNSAGFGAPRYGVKPITSCPSPA